MVQITPGASVREGVLRFAYRNEGQTVFLVLNEELDVPAQFRIHLGTLELSFHFPEIQLGDVIYDVTGGEIQGTDSQWWQIDCFKLIQLQKNKDFIAIGTLTYRPDHDLCLTWEFAGRFRGALPIVIKHDFLVCGDFNAA